MAHSARAVMLLLLAALPCLLRAHGTHNEQNPIQADPSADWATRHMSEEHHISDFDGAAFFALHDFDSSGVWDPQEIRRTYGLADPTYDGVSEERKNYVVKRVVDVFTGSNSANEGADAVLRGLTAAEFEASWKQGTRLPDFGFGPGHHGDDEYEYEIHHFEIYHDENTREEDLIHPEDIEHFRKHDLEHDQLERQERLDHMPIVEANIPLKFRRTH